jgi:plastocyanin
MVPKAKGPLAGRLLRLFLSPSGGARLGDALVCQLFEEVPMKATPFHRPRIFVLAVLTLGFTAAALTRAEGKDHKAHTQVIVPGEDRFLPFALTIKSGESVQWINNDTDDHTVVANDFFNTADNAGVNIVIPGTDNNGGMPGTLTLHFDKPGLWAYYCRFHSHLDGDHQPVAPGPDGGIQDSNGNFGTPMNGVITVLPGD